ncbi:hypothetical protein [Bacillus thuringiensis]|uniref:hypothetical protein n=1 Tax=Bacillus thuringiensis TaxID=1428 RepID=UPI0011459657|nr:hypothetical protein [Bacillus thuringiensis]
METRYLGQIFEPGQRIEIIRIVDSKSEKYSIRHAYQKTLLVYFTSSQHQKLKCLSLLMKISIMRISAQIKNPASIVVKI